MKCEDIEKLLPDFLKGNLEPDVKKKIKAHLEECSECRLEAKSLNMLWEKLDEMPEEMPSKRMDERFETMMEAYSTGVRRGKAEVSLGAKLNEFISKLFPKTPALQFALVAVIFIAGLVLGNTLNLTGGMPESELTQIRNAQRINQQLILALMNQTSTSERLKSVMQFTDYEKLNEEAINSLITVLNNDPDPSVRLKSIEILNKLGHPAGLRGVFVFAVELS